MFIVADMARWAATQNGPIVIQSHRLQNGLLFAFAGTLFKHNQEWIFLSLCALISEMICSHIAAVYCATGNFCAWRVPLHNDERNHNLISTFIYRTHCSNGVITSSSAPCRSVSSSPSFCGSPISALFIPWRMHLKPCKWEQVNKWMFHECFYDEKMQMRVSERMNV